jgi:NAD(P)H-hydrate repair Nnr-like enzyme with NAD(P)H-hydrate epimerase domain
VARWLAVDVPSGLMPEAPDALCAPADLTVTFHAPKPVHVAPQTTACCGAVRVVDIGL